MKNGCLAGKIAIITGAAGGLGKCIAKEFASEGANLSLWDVDSKALEGFQIGDSPAKKKVEKAVVNVANEEMVHRAVNNVIAAWGRIDILVNNAGICRSESIEQITEEEWDRVLAVNLKGTFLSSREVMSTMKTQRSGKIINVGSVAGKIGGIASGAHYSASKAGVMCFTKSLAREMAPFNVNVNGIAPGVIETEMTLTLSCGNWEDYRKSIPLNRIGEAKDVARVAVFLASSDADYLTGEIIDVNGGQFMD
ncbi:MAG: SDR family NAD(P)-dependent oxidoreductase [Desulfopila sp.]